MLAIALLTFVRIDASPPEIVMRFLDPDSGKPLAGVYLGIAGWNADDFHSEAQKIVFQVSSKTDKDGRVVIHLPDPPPKYLAYGSPGQIHGCSTNRFLVEDVIRSGIVAKLDQKCGQIKQAVSPKPGEVIIFDKKFTRWDWFKQELPHK
jgi:hypothetical protein